MKSLNILLKLPHFLKYTPQILIWVLSALSFTNCSQGKSQQKESPPLEKIHNLPEKNEVDVIVLKPGNFKNEIISNGKLVALQKNSLKFDVSGSLEQLYVKNGYYVKKGQTLAALKAVEYEQKLVKAEINLAMAELEFHDKIVGRGYETFNKDSIPKNEYNILAIRSGFKEAKNDLKNARQELSATKLIAPFSGKIAGIHNKQYEQINSNTEVMTLIDDGIFEVEFHLIESEIGDIGIRDKIQLQPFAFDRTYKGHIVTINPQVEEDGTILIKALVKNDGRLLEGMNVKVFIQKDVPDQFIVPKSAVILRQNQEVVFTVKSGKAYWVYVQTTYENSLQYSIIPHPNNSNASLIPGDTIIISGNLNLAHDTEVFVKETKE